MSITHTDVETAGQLLGYSRSYAYKTARSGDFPGLIPHSGRAYRVSIFGIAAALGCSEHRVRELIAEIQEERGSKVA